MEQVRMDKLLTYTQVAARLGISAQRVGQLVAAGQIGTERIGPSGRFVRVRESELRRFEAQRRAERELPEALPVG